MTTPGEWDPIPGRQLITMGKSDRSIPANFVARMSQLLTDKASTTALAGIGAVVDALNLSKAEKTAVATLTAQVGALQATVDALTLRLADAEVAMGGKAAKSQVRLVVKQSGAAYQVPADAAAFAAKELNGPSDPAAQTGLPLSDYDEWNQPQ